MGHAVVGWTEGLTPFGQAFLVHAPEQYIDPVLAKEGFTLENHRRYTPMARFFQRLLVAVDSRIISFRISFDRRIKFGQIEPGTRCRILEAVPLVPVHRPAKDQM